MREFMPVIMRSSLFAGIAAADVPPMLTCLSARSDSYKKGAFVLRAGSRATQVGLVLQGSVHVIKEDFWGRRMLIAEATASDLFAEAYCCVRTEELPVGVVAAEAARILFLDYQKVVAICSNSCAFHARLIRNMLEILAQKNMFLTQKMEHMARRTTREKLLSYLSAQAVKAGSANFSIPFNRQQLADYLSVDRSAMSNELSKMQDEGLLTFSRNAFTLKI